MNITDGRGTRWAINNDGIYLALRAAIRAAQIRKRSRIVTIQNGFLMPKTYLYETDFTGFREAVDAETSVFYREAETAVAHNAQHVHHNLLAMIASARSDLNEIERLRSKASGDSAKSIEGNVRGWVSAAQVAQFTRDTSATILVFGASILSGGAAWATLGAGSVMRGTATFQDTGNVGSALLNTTGTFVVGGIGIAAGAKGLSTSDKWIILSIGSGRSGTTAGLQALVEGKSGDVALKHAFASAGLSLVGAMIGIKTENMSLPVKLTVNGLADHGSSFALKQIGAAPQVPIKPKGPIAPPPVRGKVDYADIPLNPALDAEYLRQKCMRPA